MTGPENRSHESRRPDLHARLHRDLLRYDRREPGSGSFWQSLGVLGSVGWPIVTTMVGGALLGRWLDARWNTGIWLTLILLVGGAVAGSVIVWHLIRPRAR